MRRFVWLALPVLLLSGCSLFSHEAPNQDVDKASGLFFQRLTDANYEVIYTDSAETFRQKQTREVIINNLKKLTELGKILDYRRIKMSFGEDTKDKICVPVYVVKTEHASGEITLSFVDENGEWKLLGFSYKAR